MIEGRANTRLARVAVVKPVMMEGHPAVGRLALHAAQTGLATVNEMVVRDGDVCRLSLDVHRAVALSLVGIAAGIAIEEVHVVNPDIAVVGIQRQAVVHAEHDGEVTELHVTAVTAQDAKAPDGSIVAHALQGDGNVGKGTLALHLQSL